MKQLDTVQFYNCDFYNLEALYKAQNVYIKNENETIKDVKGLSELRNVIKLQLSGFGELSVQDLNELEKIKGLDLRDSKCNINQLKIKDDACSKIKLLGLSNFDTSNENQYNKLVSILSATEQIQSLRLTQSSLTDDSKLEKLSDILLNKKDLTELDLCYNNFSSLKPFEKLSAKLKIACLNGIEINDSNPYFSELLPFINSASIKNLTIGVCSAPLDVFSGLNKTYEEVIGNRYTTVFINGYNIYYGNSLNPETYGNYDEGSTTWKKINNDKCELDTKSYTINKNENSEIDFRKYEEKDDSARKESKAEDLDLVCYLFPYLEELYINNCNIDFNNDCTALKYFKNLKTIHINNCGSVDCKIFEQDNLANTIEHISVYNTPNIENQDIFGNAEKIKLPKIYDVNINGACYLFKLN